VDEAQTRSTWAVQAVRLLMLLTIVWLIAEGLLGMTGWSKALSTVPSRILTVWLVGAPIAAPTFVVLRFVQVSRKGRRDLALLADALLGVCVVAVWLAVAIKGAFFTVWL